MILDEETVRRLAATTRFRSIEQLAEVDSTNRYLVDRARAGAAEGAVVVADHQTAGRGRLGRTWEAPPGRALLLSVLLRPGPPDGVRFRAEQRWLAPAAVALAAADACGPAVTIKWPNDLLLEGRKVAGVLAAATGGGSGADRLAIVVGIGINVGWAPPGAAALGATVDRGDLLATLLLNLEGWLRRWGDVGPAYRERCGTVGQEVRVELAGEPGSAPRIVLGRADAVEPDGRLRVVTEEGVCTFSAADVVHLRTARNVTEA